MFRSAGSQAPNACDLKAKVNAGRQIQLSFLHGAWRTATGLCGFTTESCKARGPGTQKRVGGAPELKSAVAGILASQDPAAEKGKQWPDTLSE